VGRIPKILIALGASGCAVLACANIFGIHGGMLEDSGAGDGSVIDAPYDYVVHDAINLDVNTANCGDAAIPIVADNAAVWVSGKIGKDQTGCGIKTSPCASIGWALSHITGSLTVVYLDDSIFPEDLTLGGPFANFTIQGGFQLDDAGTWTAECDTQLTTIQCPPDGGSSTVDINGATGITFRLLTIRSKVNGAPGTGESVYAMRVFDTAGVILDNVTLLAQSGGAGAVGTTESASINCDQSNGGSGADGSVGTPGAAGQLGPQGFVPDIAGDGGTGDMGTLTPPSAGAFGNCWSCN